MCPPVPNEDDLNLPVELELPSPPRFDAADSEEEWVMEEPRLPNPPIREPSPPPPAFEVADLCEDGRLIWVPELVLGVDSSDFEEPEFLGTLASRRRRAQALVHPDKTQDGGRLSR